MSITYQATYSIDRWNGVPNCWVECEGEGIRFESNLALPFVQIICQALKNAGKSDGSIVFYEDGYVDPSYIFPSVYEIVERMNTPSETTVSKSENARSNVPKISEAIFLALQKIQTNPRDWTSLNGKARSVLLDRNYVSVENAVPEITELGHAACSAYEKTRPQPKPVIEYPADLAKATQDELLHAATVIGLKTEQNLARALAFIEKTANKHSVFELEEMAFKVNVPVRTARCKTDMMKKRRILAAISNAGKLAQAI